MGNRLSLFVITPPEDLPGETMHISSFLEDGAAGVYIRKASCTAEYLGLLFSTVKKVHHQKVILPLAARRLTGDMNHSFHVKEQERLSAPHGEGSSTSIHTLEDWGNLRPNFIQVFYGPVFDSISKPGHRPTKDLGKLEQQITAIRSRRKDLPLLIALGGIRKENIGLLREGGFDGAAVLGSVWEGNPSENFRTLRSEIL